ncbi:ribosomal protein 60S [Obba rivulosa]|uniref:Ribosomal protein 60S n=1 Tax=Obba rivulosa TaxID=1052685 RepID=A0A8E2DQ22_9APHY|nr:ribosomal protein 60S [Obba rivulosa]
MRHLAAYLLLQIGGNASPSAEDVKNVLGAVGIEADEERLAKLISELEGKDVNALIAEGSAKLSSVPSGGAAVASSGAAAGGAPAAAAEEKKEEEKKEEKEESDDDMGFGLFD